MNIVLALVLGALGGWALTYLYLLDRIEGEE
jgi:hypothetical protein